MAKIIGIDLGTTNSVVAFMEGGTPKVIPSQEGPNIIPSVVAYTKDGKRLVGTLAKRQSITNPENTIYSAKRFIGRKYEEVAQEAKNIPYKIIKLPNGDAGFEIQGKQYSPQEIIRRLSQPVRKTVESIRQELADRNRHLADDLEFALQYKARQQED